jgi:hypothetical protein
MKLRKIIFHSSIHSIKGANGLKRNLIHVIGPAIFGRSNRDSPQPKNRKIKNTVLSFKEFFFNLGQRTNRRNAANKAVPKNGPHFTYFSPLR